MFDPTRQPRPLHLDEEVDQLLAIVTGTELHAEASDRPLAYQLQQAVWRWLGDHQDLMNVRIQPVVCADVWYVNQPDMPARPTISVGGPGVNVLTACLSPPESAPEVALPPGAQAPSEGKMVIQLDENFVDLRVCLWGTSHKSAREAVELFVAQYLPAFMRAVATQVEPMK